VNIRSLSTIGVGAGYGLVLFLVGSMLSGLGEGSPIPLIVFGSPLTIGGLYSLTIPAYWTAFSLLLVRRQSLGAAGWLLAQLVSLPLVVPRRIRTECLSCDLRLVHQLFEGDPVLFVALSAVYVCGYVAAWMLILRS
jgi:hypothetical protein